MLEKLVREGLWTFVDPAKLVVPLDTHVHRIAAFLGLSRRKTADWKTARECQFRISRLWTLFKEQYPSSLKGAMIMMGRPVGPTRAPLPTATKERIGFLRSQLEELGILQTEPHGW